VNNHVMNELHAGVANLKAIKRSCTQGQLATYELAEMLENPYLSEISPEDTKLDSLVVNMQKQEAEFAYRYREGIQLGSGTLVYTAGVVFIFFVLTMMATYFYQGIKQQRAAPFIQKTGRNP